MSIWTCPITGLQVPKDPEANIQWRAEILSQAETDDDLQLDLYTACSQSILFFINAFCFTLRLAETDDDGLATMAENTHLPFVTWPIQDAHITRLAFGVGAAEERELLQQYYRHLKDTSGRSLLTDKSRDMGATWDHIVLYVHRFLFRSDESHLMLSRKEECVDLLDGRPTNYPHGMIANPGSLFGKVDYVLSRLPEWMLPRMARHSMHLVNLENRSRIDGESTNATAGSSDRRHSIFLDEMAKMKEGEAIKRSTKDVTPCRFVCSTPNGAGTAYSKWRMSGKIPVMILPWWEHPEKGLNRYVAQDELGRWKIRSPFYDQRCAEDSPKEIAIELDMDHVGSGDTFFEHTIIEQHKTMFARPPKHAKGMTINFVKGVADDRIPDLLRKWEPGRHLVVTFSGAWKVWANLIKGRLDQTKTYIVSCDLGKGQGASNSVCNITCVETRHKVASLADANTPPHAFARLVVAACMWCGGRNKRPLLIWENNGDPGFDFGNQIVKAYEYPNVYFDKQAGTVREKVGKRWGWRSSPEKKAIALGMLRKAYAHGQFFNPDAMALDEALTYITYESGGIGPADLVEESDSTRKAHGDRVIADMLAVVGMRGFAPLRSKEENVPRNSIGHRFNQWKREKQKAAQKNTFDFSGANQ